MKKEGETYLCEWKKTGKEFRVSVIATPDWRASDASFEEAEGELLNVIEQATGDLRPNCEYEPERPKGVIQAKYEGCGIVAVSGANDAEDFIGNPEELFSGGVCPVCKSGFGARTEVPLKISTQLPANSDGAFVRVRVAGPFVSFSIEIFSSEFLNALSTEERARFKWLPVEGAKKTKKVFFEPVSQPLANKVMPKGLFQEKDRLQSDGIYCQKCQRRELRGIPQGGGIYTFLCADDLPAALPSCFQVGQAAALEFCMTKNRWSDLVGKSGTRRIMSRQVGIVKMDWVNPNPKLEMLSK
jgi:hypothetical protein